MMPAVSEKFVKLFVHLRYYGIFAPFQRNGRKYKGWPGSNRLPGQPQDKNAAYILTRNTKDFRKGIVNVITPEELLAIV